MAFNDASLLDVKVEIIEDLQAPDGVEKACAALGQHFGIPVAEMSSREYVGIVLADGMSGAEEGLIEKIGDSTNVVFIGGSAGDDLKFSSTHLYANGKSYNNAALLALLKPGADFTFIKTQSFRDLGKKLLVTKADEASRTVLEFNNKPAATAYAEMINTPVENISNFLMHNPVGFWLMVNLTCEVHSRSEPMAPWFFIAACVKGWNCHCSNAPILLRTLERYRPGAGRVGKNYWFDQL